MSTYNEIVYNQGVYGSTVSSDIDDVRFVQSNLIEVVFNKELTANADYYNLVGLGITFKSGAPISIRNVLKLSTNVSATNVLNIVTDSAQEGSEFYLHIPAYLVRDGTSTATAVVYVKYTRTKVENELRSIPSHFDKSLTSNINSILSAIGSSDEIIGGSRQDLV